MAYAETIQIFRKADKMSGRFEEKIPTSLFTTMRIGLWRKGWKVKALSVGDKYTRFIAIKTL